MNQKSARLALAPQSSADGVERGPTNAATGAAGAVVDCDVLVIGGGPAGATAATLLARRGWRVLCLEKSRHPRFHIGESLLPMNLPILERLGVLAAVDAIGVRKTGADFPKPGGDGATNVFRFERALYASPGHAYQVRRDEFDALLFDNARAAGADARDGVAVTGVAFGADDRPTVAYARDDAGRAFEIRMRHLIDASGRDTFLGNRLKTKRKLDRHQSAALFSHYRGVERRPGEDAGNITIERFEHGWVWLIPLRDDVMSVGAVCSPEYLKQRRGDGAEFLERTLDRIPTVRARMRGATRVAPVHATGNYSYRNARMSGPGWTMVGDAYAFIDPVFSSGVYLAMHGAERAAEVVDAALREPAREARLQRALRKELDKGLAEFSWFIYRFTGPVMRQLFSNPRNALQIEQAVISMLAGDVYAHPGVTRRLRLFRAIYALTALGMARTAWRDRWRRTRRPAVEFGGDTLQTDGSADEATNVARAAAVGPSGDLMEATTGTPGGVKSPAEPLEHA
ncbi:MAG: FAD-binding protein [Lysobacter sp.]|nr:MAG: FAD-binding protein [Lysobacter sp.]